MRIGLAWWVLLLALLWASYSHAACVNPDLHNEFFTDPTSRAYAACSTDGDLANPVTTSDSCVLEKFNALCADNAACKVDNILSNIEVMQTIIDSNELDALANSTAPGDAGKKQQLSWLLALPSYNMAKASFQQKWKNVFKPASSPLTNTKINDAQLKDAPRSQIICGRPGNLNDISCGLRGACS